MTKTQQFLLWWSRLENNQKFGFICTVVFALGYLILFIKFPVDMFILSIIITAIVSICGLINFLFINPPWDND